MSSFAIVTDSTANLPKAFIEKHQRTYQVVQKSADGP